MSKPTPAKVLTLSGRWKAKPPKSGGGHKHWGTDSTEMSENRTQAES